MWRNVFSELDLFYRDCHVLTFRRLDSASRDVVFSAMVILYTNNFDKAVCVGPSLPPCIYCRCNLSRHALTKKILQQLQKFLHTHWPPFIETTDT